MDWLWELLRGNPWLALILLGVVGQLFTPNPKKRKAARQRTPPADPQSTRTDPDEVAERIRELFAGKSTPEPVEIVETYEPVQVDEVAAPHHAVAGSYFDPDSIGEGRASNTVLAVGMKRKGRTGVQYADPDAVGAGGVSNAIVPVGMAGIGRTGAHSLDLRTAVRALLILGPPRALASYDHDPLLSLHLRER